MKYANKQTNKLCWLEKEEPAKHSCNQNTMDRIPLRKRNGFASSQIQTLSPVLNFILSVHHRNISHSISYPHFSHFWKGRNRTIPIQGLEKHISLQIKKLHMNVPFILAVLSGSYQLWKSAVSFRKLVRSIITIFNIISLVADSSALPTRRRFLIENLPCDLASYFPPLLSFIFISFRTFPPPFLASTPSEILSINQLYNFPL